MQPNRFSVVFIRLFVLANLLSSANLFAQDSVKMLSAEEFLQWVRQYHPVAQQALLSVDMAKANVLSSRGAFDPLLYISSDQKTFDGKNYYQYTDAQLKIPTWFGVEVMAGIENNGGDFTSPEVTINKSSFAGLSIPLAKNLLLDKRRAVLAQAKLMVDQSNAERLLIVNDVLFEAMDAYWFWAKEYQVYRLLNDVVKLNEDRYKLIKVTVEQGDRAGVDSTEAFSQLATFRFMQNEAKMRFLNAGFLLSNYLWSQNNQPILLDTTVIPAIDLETANPFILKYQPLQEMLSIAQTEHPKLKVYDYKMDILTIEKKLKFQSLLPTVNLKYNALSKDYTFWKGWNTATIQNNYKFGLDIGMPLFLRQGRGDYKAAKLKLANTQLDIVSTQLSIQNKVKQYHNELLGLLEQVRIYNQAVTAFRKVFDVEMMRFEVGESSLFLVNSRENKVLEARQKMVELKAKCFKALYGVQYAAGVLR